MCEGDGLVHRLRTHRLRRLAEGERQLTDRAAHSTALDGRRLVEDKRLEVGCGCALWVSKVEHLVDERLAAAEVLARDAVEGAESSREEVATLLSEVESLRGREQEAVSTTTMSESTIDTLKVREKKLKAMLAKDRAALLDRIVTRLDGMLTDGDDVQDYLATAFKNEFVTKEDFQTRQIFSQGGGPGRAAKAGGNSYSRMNPKEMEAALSQGMDVSYDVYGNPSYTIKEGGTLPTPKKSTPTGVCETS